MSEKIYFGSVELYDPKTGEMIKTPPTIFTEYDTPKTYNKAHIYKHIANKKVYERLIIKKLCFETAKHVGNTNRK